MSDAATCDEDFSLLSCLAEDGIIDVAKFLEKSQKEEGEYSFDEPSLLECIQPGGGG